MKGPTVLQLRCEACGGPLHGTPQALLFCCGDCGAIFEIVAGRFVARQGLTAKAAHQAGGRLGHLPFWGFRVRAAWQGPEETRMRAGGWRAPEWVYVTAFSLSNAFYFGDPGLIFTQRRIVLAATEPAPVVGGTRSLDEAKIFIEPHILSLLDRRVDVTGVTMSVVIDEAVLWAIPYFDDGVTLTDGVLGHTLPGAALDEIGALRAWWERGR
ncbi:MAG: hypothetical protein EHM71_11990 [Zetaproteobacteria bacterium]|nr:MAG: hypothetical protein EHM71_11990 [Zetaproteobacteria bacterium]